MAGRGQTGATSERLKALREVDTGAVAKVIAGAVGTVNGGTAAMDDHDVHTGIVRHLGLGFGLGRSVELIGEARRLTGDAKRARIDLAIRYLQDEARHC